MNKISINKLKYRLENPNTHTKIYAYCPDCKNWSQFIECDAPCPYWDPYCFHAGHKCKTCRSEFDFMEGYKEIIKFNEELNKQEYYDRDDFD